MDDFRHGVLLFYLRNSQKTLLENGHFLLESDDMIRGDSHFLSLERKSIELIQDLYIIIRLIISNGVVKIFYCLSEYCIKSLQFKL